MDTKPQTIGDKGQTVKLDFGSGTIFYDALPGFNYQGKRFNHVSADEEGNDIFLTPSNEKYKLKKIN